MLTEVLYLTRKGDRQQLAADIRKALEPLGVTVAVREGTRDLAVTLSGHGLSALVHLDARAQSEAPMIHWHEAQRDLVGAVRGAWSDVNNIHRRKATSFPCSMIDVIERLQRGFQAAADGSAFMPYPAGTEMAAAGDHRVEPGTVGRVVDCSHEHVRLRFADHRVLCFAPDAVALVPQQVAA
jgi:hypothetical protein